MFKGFHTSYTIHFVAEQFILPGKISQDALKNLFSWVWSSLGNNTHPSINDFRHIISYQKYELWGWWCVALPFKDTIFKELQKYLKLNKSDTEEGDPEDKANYVIESRIQRYISGYSVYMSALRKTICSRCLKGNRWQHFRKSYACKNYNNSKVVWELAFKQCLKKIITEYIIIETNTKCDWLIKMI